MAEFNCGIAKNDTEIELKSIDLKGEHGHEFLSCSSRRSDRGSRAVCDQPHAGKGGISGADADH